MICTQEVLISRHFQFLWVREKWFQCRIHAIELDKFYVSIKGIHMETFNPPRNISYNIKCEWKFWSTWFLTTLATMTHTYLTTCTFSKHMALNKKQTSSEDVMLRQFVMCNSFSHIIWCVVLSSISLTHVNASWTSNPKIEQHEQEWTYRNTRRLFCFI